MNIKQLTLTLTLAVTPVVSFAQYYFDTSYHFNNQNRVSAADIYRDGLKMADMQLERKIENEYIKLFRQTDGDLYKMRELSLQLKVSPWLTPKIDEKIRQKELQELERLRIQAEIARLESATRQNNAEAQAIREKVAQKEMSIKQPQHTRRALTNDEIRQVLPHIDHPANRQNQLPQLNESQRINLD